MILKDKNDILYRKRNKIFEREFYNKSSVCDEIYNNIKQLTQK